MKKNYRKRKFVDIEVLKVEKSKKSESEMKVYNPTFFNFVLGVKGISVLRTMYFLKVVPLWNRLGMFKVIFDSDL